jgi:ECF sigma factor
VEHTLSALIASAEAGEALGVDAIFTALYEERHRMAPRQLAGKGRDLILGTTTLLHEAYLDMPAREGTTFPDRARFLGVALERGADP